MSIDSKHPDYAVHKDDWVLMRDAYAGERAVKAKGEVYLPATPGQVLDGARTGDSSKPGYIAYMAYKDRARFPDYVTEAVVNFVGLMHQKEAEITLPAVLEPMRDHATVDGESLLNLLRRINEQQLVAGRLCLMLDFPKTVRPGESPLPYIALYHAESVINWDASADGENVNALNLVVLDESGPTRDKGSFVWRDVQRHRVLQLRVPTPQPADGAASEEAGEPGTEKVDATEGLEAVYMQGVFEGNNFSDDGMVPQMYRGQTINKLPVVMINAQDCVPAVGSPPLLGLGRECLAIYRGEADYRFTLFMQGQDTFVTVGEVMQDGKHVRSGEDNLRLGAGAWVAMGVNGSASYEGIGAEGLAEQRSALENDHKAAAARSGKLISPQAGRQESGDALSTRLAAQTVSLTTVATTAAAGLELLLRVAAEWMGAKAEEVVVNPNKEFSVLAFSGQDATSYMAAKTMGFPLSIEAIHGILRDRKMTPFTFEEEMKKIEAEDAERIKRLGALMPTDPAEGAVTGKPPGAGNSE